MARSYIKRRARHTPRENNGFWLTFSDLMSALVLVFILLVFYSMYQYFDMLELKTAELMRQSGLLDAKQEELSASQEELNASQGKLTESEIVLAQQQYQLVLTKQAQEAAEQTLSEQRKDLDDALVLLQMREEDLAAARSLVENQQNELSNQQVRFDSQQAQLEAQQVQLEALVGVRSKIVESLVGALTRANVKATVDAHTGSIALDASVMFDLGKNELREEGKAVLDQFVPIYLGVLLEADNQANISEVIIEGHTDSRGGYLDNLKLSQERALAVMTYMLSDENTYLSGQMKQQLRRIGTCNGRSFANLIYTPEGKEDAEASRRVEFKFRMQDEQMIESMRTILSDMDGGVAP